MKLIKFPSTASFRFVVNSLALAITLVFIVSATAPVATAATGPTLQMCSTTVLYPGARGDCVRTLQVQLNSAGSSTGTVDGSFGPKTRAGVIDYQRKNGIRTTGNAGPLTWGSLVDRSLKLPASPASSGGKVIVQPGSSRSTVADLQNRLARASFPVGRDGSDGSYGFDTRSAVAAFQKHYGLPATGTVDDRTWDALVKNPGAPASRLAHLNSIKNNRGVNIVADKSDRVAYVFRDGKLLRSITVRFGGEGVFRGAPYSKNTPNGIFWVQAKIKNGTSTLYDAKMPYFTVFNGHIGFHQSADFKASGYGSNGRRGSHGCINIGNEADAKFLFEQARTGHTRVAVQN